ncbi:hypothetical protein CERSUDRAFT_114528 [Gelatoporia subvermispora B]|uniref:Ribonuclease H2 subunit B n=1 Tax=Ceriporiopsis subvermispora (strain B) TaxID=914234 RepID=M2QLI8_CERS8|nr:hypothetical protein CERSUDRAFT_114528 [Gelatoporia subvermispora B]
MASQLGVLPRDVIDSMLPQLPSLEGTAESTPSQLRFIKLFHPRTGLPSLFLPHRSSVENEATSVLEVQMVSPPEKRSWFMSSDEVVEDGKLLLLTPIDPAFLLIPILRSLISAEGDPGNFRPIDDLFEDAAVKLKSLESSSQATTDLLYLSSLPCVQTAMSRICETKDITEDITVYRFSTLHTMEYLQLKVGNLRRPEILESSKTILRNLAKDGLMEDGKETLLELARTRAACELVSQYLPRDLYTTLLGSYDFAPLDAYLKTLREEEATLAAADMSKVEMRESQTQSSASGDKKRKGQTKASYGVEKLKKANVKGMSKISSFFQKTVA